jgi:hypothetical protein
MMITRAEKILSGFAVLEGAQSHDHPDSIQKNIQGVLNSADPSATKAKIERLADALKNKENRTEGQQALVDKLDKVLAGLEDVK